MTERSRALTVLLAVFVLGGIVGAAAYHMWSLRASANDGAFGPPFWRGRGPVMQDVLQLTADQQKQFDEIMRESGRRMQALQAESAPKFKSIRAETDAKILAILNVEQKQKFEEFIRDMDRRMERRRGPRESAPFPPIPGGPAGEPQGPRGGNPPWPGPDPAPASH
jgi:Spy/CpxP family protein refolding chaperone